MSSIQTPRYTTLFKNDSLWVLNKPVQTHFDEIFPQISEAVTQSVNWEAVHRLDFETSGCLLFSPPALAPQLREKFKASRGVHKIYLAGASRPLETRFLGLQRGVIGSRYKSSPKVKFQPDDEKFRGYHSITLASHRVSLWPKEDWTQWIDPRCDENSRRAFEKLFEHAYKVELISGARHQIRAFFEYAGASLKGDPVYNAGDQASERLALHAAELSIEDGPEKISARALLESATFL